MSENPVNLQPILTDLLERFEAGKVTIEEARKEIGLPENMRVVTLVRQYDPLNIDRIFYTLLDEESNVIQKFCHDIEFDTSLRILKRKEMFLKELFLVD